jgi:hypothetical protein
MRTLNTYSRPMIDRRINLALDDIEQIRKELTLVYKIDKEDNLIAMLNNIEIALDLKSDESDKWAFYNDGSRSHLNNKHLNN